MKRGFKAGFIGCGNMGGVLAELAAKKLGGTRVSCADLDPAKLKKFTEGYGCKASDAREIASECDFIVLGVKPQVLPQTAADIKDILAARKDRFVIISMAAGVALDSLKGYLGDYPIIRIMPNIPCASGEGVILYCRNENADSSDEDAFGKMFEDAGIVSAIEEPKIDMGSAVTGCGPAFVYMFIDAMIDGGVRCGLPRDKAKAWAIQTVLGSAKFAKDSGQEPAKLKSDVCSPAGSTIEGVAVLEEMAFRSAVMEAVKAAYERTTELGK